MNAATKDAYILIPGIWIGYIIWQKEIKVAYHFTSLK